MIRKKPEDRKIDDRWKADFRRRLLRWYEENRRRLPWRNTTNPYRILVSEVMLQQTQVSTVIPYYRRFIVQFPTVQSLAKAPRDDVLKAWEGLGYYSRGRNLHRAAKSIVSDHKGKIPDDPALLRSLPGIGAYTSAAVLSIAFGQDAAVVDGNVARVLCRLLALPFDPKSHTGRREIEALAGTLLARGRAGDWNQALMELGATVCTPRNPDCATCPALNLCQAGSPAVAHQYPVRSSPQKKKPHHRVVVALLEHRGRLLITRRPEKGLLGGLWEFPGGKLERGEQPEEALHREIREELGVGVKDLRHLVTVSHAYSHFSVTIDAFWCRPLSSRIQPTQSIDHAWVRPENFQDYAFPRATWKIIEAMPVA